MIKRIVKNFTALFTGEVIARICHFVAVIYLARVLGAAGFGAINFSLAILSYFLMVTNLGLGELGIREVARKRDVKEMTETVLSIRLTIAAVSFLSLLLLTAFLRKAPQTTYLIIAYGVTIFPYASSFEWVFVGIEKMKYNAYGRIMNAVIYMSLIFLIIRQPSDILKVAFITIFVDTAVALFYYLIYRKMFGSLRLHLDLKRYFGLLRVSAQLFVSSAMMSIYLNFGTVALGFFKDEWSVGIFSASSKLTMFFFALSTVVVTAVFPILSSLYHESQEKLQKFLAYCARLTLILGVPVGVGMTVLGPKIIGFVYGPSYANAGPLLQILGWFAAVNLTSYVVSYSLVTCDRQGVYLKILACAAALNVCLNLLATPFIGYYAPSVALVLTEVLILIWSLFAMGDIAPVPFLKLSVRPLIASAVMGLLLLIPVKVNLLALMGAAAVVYFAVLFAIGGFNKEMILMKEAFT
jgi:O-antigen/teichoic acid export membrane protein